MKLSKYLVGTLACALMAACSNEENVQGENLLNEGGQAYMAINLVAPSTMSRTFEEGQGNESTIGTGRFYFFDASGNAVTVNTVNNNDVNYVEESINFDGNKSSGTDNIEYTETVLVLEGNSATPTQMIAILNPPTSLGATSISLEDLLKKAADYKTGLEGEDKFVMSNSVYYNSTDSKIINVVENIARHISTTPEAAQNDPVDIYVERVLAKVAVTQGEQSGTLDGNTSSFDTSIDFDTDGNESTAQSADVKAKIKGWTIANRSKISYLVKQIDANWVTTSPFKSTTAVWNAPKYFRSYWAQIPTENNDVVNDTTYSQITNFGAKYCQERTGTTPNTVLLVAAELQVNGIATSIAKYAGQLWTLNDLKTHICGQIQRSATPIYYSTDNGINYSPLTKDQIKFRMRTTDEKEDVKAYESVVTLADAAESYTFAKKSSEVGENDKYANVDAVNDILNTYKALVWDEGKTYYYVPIEHSIGSSNTEKLYGVVRNHYYKINITGVKGLGTPIPPTEEGGSEEPIDPETPTDEYSYLAARINVLSWNVVAQDDVVLGK